MPPKPSPRPHRRWTTTRSATKFSRTQPISIAGFEMQAHWSLLTRYDIYAMGRYEHVRAALSDWQSFESAAGVGLSNFRYERPWRPPSLLLRDDPPHHDAPERCCRRC